MGSPIILLVNSDPSWEHFLTSAVYKLPSTQRLKQHKFIILEPMGQGSEYRLAESSSACHLTEIKVLTPADCVGSRSYCELVQVAGRIHFLLVVGLRCSFFFFCRLSSIKEWINKSQHVPTVEYSSAIKAENY